MTNEKRKETRVATFLAYVQNQRIIAILIFIGIVIIGVSKFADSADSILRKIGLIKSYNINETTIRGRFSSALLENAWNRMFWMRSYTERVRLHAPLEEQKQAWGKYIDASEKWSSNIMNYYLGLDEYYPKTNKRQILEGTIQPQFIHAGQIITRLKYNTDTMSKDVIEKIDSVQNIVNDLNVDFYFLIDQNK